MGVEDEEGELEEEDGVTGVDGAAASPKVNDGGITGRNAGMKAGGEGKEEEASDRVSPRPICVASLEAVRAA